jgi:magnesium transporter
MQAEFIAVRPTWTVGHTIDYLRSTEDLPHRFYELYVVDAAHRLLGAVALDQLLRTKRPVPLAEVMIPDRQRVHTVDDLNEVARLFEHYNLIAAPVVDAQDRLVGVLTVDDIVDVIEEKADEEIKALGGVGDEKLSDSVWTISLSRFNWLLINLATAFLASAVLGLFQGQLQKMVALAVLAPIVASQGRQRRHADHDGGGARVGDPRSGPRECLAY